MSDQSQPAADARAEAEQLIKSVPHWHHSFEIFPGITTRGNYQPEFLWNKIGPQEWKGKRVLDIGPADGALSMWAARAGAQVTAVDKGPKTRSGFAVMEQLSGLAIDYRVANVLDLPYAGLGLFDRVFFLGVLYHLPDPLRGLYACRQVCRDRLFVETWHDPDLQPDIPAARYLPGGSNPDPSNFWVPNRLAVLSMISDAGFDVVREEVWDDRMFVEARVSTDSVRLWRIASAYAAEQS